MAGGAADLEYFVQESAHILGLQDQAQDAKVTRVLAVLLCRPLQHADSKESSWGFVKLDLDRSYSSVIALAHSRHRNSTCTVTPAAASAQLDDRYM